MEKQMVSTYVRLPTGEFSPLFAFLVNFYIIFDGTTHSLIYNCIMYQICIRFEKRHPQRITIGQKFSIPVIIIC